MQLACDFHFHSLYSDGRATPTDLVRSAVKAEPKARWLSLSDHNTYAGCPEFLAACKERGIEGFASAEISGSHPDYQHVEFHFLACLGNRWADRVEARARSFVPFFNRHLEVDTANVFRFLSAAGSIGCDLDYRHVSALAVEQFLALPEPRSPGLMKPVSFKHLRALIRSMGDALSPGFEKLVWSESGVTPAPSPFISEAYTAFRVARPAVTLAHPMKYDWSIEQAKPLLEEWKAEIGLFAIEAHYGGTMHDEWREVASELSLAVSAGSDCHSRNLGACLPRPDFDESDFEAFLARLRSAGDA